MSEVIEVNNQFYILAGSSLADDRALALKDGDTFGLFDHFGDIHPYGLGEQGIFHEGTRFLSLLDLRIEKKRPLFLSSITRTRNETLVIGLSNPDFQTHHNVSTPRGTIHIARSKFLWAGTCHEGLEISNFGMNPIEFWVSLKFDADFADIFEVRGTRRERRGERSGPSITDGNLIFSYGGLDGVVRRTRISFSPAPTLFADGTARFVLNLQPRVTEKVCVSIQCEIGDSTARAKRYEIASQAVIDEVGRLRADFSSIDGSRGSLNDLLERSCADICMMLTRTDHGLYPHAGVPWFCAPFGRDGIITALQTLWVNPTIARGVLAFLAQTQAQVTDDSAEANPGKILHEMRRGELAALGEIPFRQYYGSVDSTPLFVMLACAYYDHTADREFVERIWPNVEAAIDWIDRYGDSDGDGFVEYSQRSENGLFHQGWKDSRDSVFHDNGHLADGPIALCEVQGYVYAAKRGASRLCSMLGDKSRSAQLEREAQALYERFNRVFWCERKSTYALALDGEKEPCEVRSSNPGHCLYTGIVSQEHAPRLVRTLMSETSFSGWGIRTVDSTELRYNPMSYHNGSVWPHDNAIITQGLSAYGFKQEALHLLSSASDLGRSIRLHRLPELICGFSRLDSEGPTLYPVACSPQAWAAGSIYMMLQACVGLRVDAANRCLRFEHPVLPPFIDDLRIRNLRVGSAVVDLSFHRYPENVGIRVDRRAGPVEIVVLK